MSTKSKVKRVTKKLDKALLVIKEAYHVLYEDNSEEEWFRFGNLEECFTEPIKEIEYAVKALRESL